MSNPRIEQGSINRLLASVVFADFPELNVTSPFLSKEGISIAWEGETSLLLGTMTGAVTSPAPYIFAMVTMHLVKSQFLAEAYKQQIETSTTMGSVNVIPDTITLSPYQLDTVVLESMQEQLYNGTQEGLVIKLKGVYRINSDAFFSS
jgi:hypothetical protein